MDTITLLAIFSGIAVTAAVFIPIYLTTIAKGDRNSRLLLAGIILAIGIRIFKSIIYYLFGIPQIGVATGYLGLALIGVFTWLYIRNLQNGELGKGEILHLIPGVVGFMMIWPLQLDLNYYVYIYGTASLGVYLMFSWRSLVLMEIKDSKKKKWLIKLLTIVSLVWATLVYQFLTSSMYEYAIGSATTSFLLYVLFFSLLKDPKLLHKLSNDKKVDESVTKQLVQALEVGKVYRTPTLTLSQISKDLSIPTYKISLSLKEHYGKSFPELINHLRIREVTDKLQKQNGEFLKIEALAYDVGFSTPSTFYAAFKKETGKTPSDFQEKEETYSRKIIA